MAFFTSRPSASFYEPNYSGLFRLIDEFNNYAQEANATDADAPASNNNQGVTKSGANANNSVNKRRSMHTSLPIWTPKFDLHETPNTYVLHGEFPGIEKKDIHIEFIDEQTMSIRGRSERVQTHSSEDDEGAAANKESSTDNNNNKDSNGKEVTHQDKDKQQVTAHKEQRPHLKYWVSERSFGEFARSFTFPSRVDPSGVVAKLDNGVLNLVVPKAAKPQGRKITVT
ncbi:small heat shock protein [Magnaporthiopsis poae ATCC 64411]|uniref:Small heat shock protein n=1 Tax=Magnaporthiopsis poae (strain ATCC 64411 / 73-15) TaxID=644358 RepID=A0A0C4DX71_MAGP6|nr:small heat shock protein [Magnaporthiopsis poae ATCC 64411]